MALGIPTEHTPAMNQKCRIRHREISRWRYFELRNPFGDQNANTIKPEFGMPPISTLSWSIMMACSLTVAHSTVPGVGEPRQG